MKVVCDVSVSDSRTIPLVSERNFQVGKYLELRFEFRTSEVNGVILSVAEPNGFPAISIELHKGKVRGSGYFCRICCEA